MAKQMVYIGKVLSVMELGRNKRKYWVQLPVINGDPYSGKKIYVVGADTYGVDSTIKVTIADQGWQIRK